MKEIREYLTELEHVNNDIINLKFHQAKTYQTLIDRIMLNCRTDIHPDVQNHLNKTKRIYKVGYWVHDLQRKLFTASRELLQFLGTDPKIESFPEEDFFKLIHKDDEERIVKSYAQDVLAHADRASAYRFITFKSELKYVVSHFTPKYDEQDNPVQVTGVIFEIPQEDVDILNTYVAERNEIIGANMGVGFWEYDAKIDAEYWSKTLYDILETNPEECPPHKSSFAKYLIPDQISRIRDIIEDNNNQNADYEFSCPIITVTGSKKQILSQVHHLVDNEGNLIKRYGLIFDVTRIKQLSI